MESKRQNASCDGSVNDTTTKCGVPEILGLTQIVRAEWNEPREDIISKIATYSRDHPETEHIYVFTLDKCSNISTDDSDNNSWLKNCLRGLQRGEQPEIVVAGSHALWILTRMLHSPFMPNWRSNDIDLFVLNQQQHGRFNLGGLDLVHTKDQTPEEVLMNFDNPCCRVAFDVNYTFYVSIHALTAILTKKVYLPSYLKEKKSFIRKLKEYETNIPSNYDKMSVNIYYEKLVDRFSERIRKYQSRGFSFQWYATDYVLPWIKTRFHYVEFVDPSILGQSEATVSEDEKIRKLQTLIEMGTGILPEEEVKRLAEQLKKLLGSSKDV